MESTCEASYCSENCGCESNAQYDIGAHWLVHKAKLMLLKEKLKERIEKQQGKELDELADLLIALVNQDQKSAAEK